MPLIHLTNDEVYHMVKLYDHLRDIDMIDDLHLRVQTSFEKIQEQEVDKDAQKVEQCIIDGNDYKDCVDRMVETMKDSTPPEVFIPNFHD